LLIRIKKVNISDKFRRNVKSKLKKYAFIVLNLEKFWKRLCSQNRAGKHAHAFVRRGVVGPKNAKLLFFYVTHPHKDIRGFADFIERVTGDAEDLWKSLGHESLLNSYDEYKDFLQGRKKATFILFRNLREFSTPVTIKNLSQIIGKEKMPQMGLYLTERMAYQLISKGGAEIGGI
jgi:predicted transcriptional regulator